MSPIAVASPATDLLCSALSAREPGSSLPSRLYTASDVFDAELEQIWSQHWIFAGAEAEIPNTGDYLTVALHTASLLVVRGDDGGVRAFHNVCRHRGSQLCDEPAGTFRRRITCPYHQWSYALDGTLARARATDAAFDPADHGLVTAPCELVGGLIFVCLTDNPPDLSAFRATAGPFLAPFDLATAKVAHQTTMIENGNWKLVWENNRECYHCRGAHPELCATFPESTLHAGDHDEHDTKELQRFEAFLAHAEELGLASRYTAAADHEFRAMRLPLVDGARSMTASGAPAVGRRFGQLPDDDLGDVLLYHYPSTWNHFMADHVVTFRVLPLTATTTELRTTWLVPGDAVEGVDYTVESLTEVWKATNAQDASLVERTQRGVASPAYRPGPYSPREEIGVIQFIDWYASACG